MNVFLFHLFHLLTTLIPLSTCTSLISIQAQLTEQTALAKEEIAGLIEDRRVRMEESEVAREKEQGEIRDLMARLKQTQELLYESTRDFLEQRLQYRRSEKEWMMEREKLLEQVDTHTGKASTGVGRISVFHSVFFCCGQLCWCEVVINML